MTRLMSVSLTEAAVVERRKTVTRRKGWTTLKPGTRLTLCRKVMGRKPGDPLVRLAEVEVLHVTREPLAMIHADPADVVREGFPDLSPDEFVRYFCEHMGGDAWQVVTRIGWRYLDGEALA